MLNLADGATVARTQLFQHDKVFGSQVQAKLDTDLQRIDSVRVVADTSWNLGIAGGRGNGARRSVQGEVPYILPLHRLCLKRLRRHVCRLKRGALCRVKGARARNAA